jgi:hypothetical protein
MITVIRSRELAAAAIALATACDGTRATLPDGDGGATQDVTTAEATADAAGDGAFEALDAGDAGAEAQAASCAAAAGEDASTVCSTVQCVDGIWAQWAMPNVSTDVAEGAPNPASYVVPGDGTVTDGVTGLMWQQAPPSAPATWADASSYCAGLALAAHADWRLPAYVELVSIVDYSRALPALDPTAFPSALPVDVWTSTLFAQDTTSAWEVYFTAGDSSQDPLSGTNSIRCVRGPDGASSPAVPPGRYVIGSGQVHDTKTGLTWQGDAPAGMFAWADARAYCAGLTDGGTGWRLPTAKELLTIVDVTRAVAPTIDCEAFPAAGAGRAWSATVVAGAPTDAWAVDFLIGYTLSVDASTPLGARCVR